MGIEIERKFLPANDTWRSLIERSQRIAQGYLHDFDPATASRQKASARVRIAGNEAYLNIKSREAGASRQEFEYAIPVSEAEALLKLCTGGIIDKVRHHVGPWEVDEFLGANAGLVVAEIELSSLDVAFERPSWLGVEVTDEQRYYNLELAAHPYTQWKKPPRLG